MWFFGKDKTSYLLGLHNTFTVKKIFLELIVSVFGKGRIYYNQFGVCIKILRLSFPFFGLYRDRGEEMQLLRVFAALYHVFIIYEFLSLASFYATTRRGGRGNSGYWNCDHMCERGSA